MLASALESFGLLEGRRAEVFAVVAELVNNAVDHGLLGLDSRLKADAEGFATFYEERARRIAEAEDGYVDVTLDVEPLEAGCVIRVTVEDSGAGFDVAALDGESDGELHGRGLSMVRELCESLRYSERGNRVEAVFRAAA
jgi:anti-sigma regulatory factor (Ser/Thr protein kinase)